MRAANEETQLERIACILADCIISGEISPGLHLRQNHIASEFGTSHVPVCEAFRELQTRGPQDR
ncbi:GntR family transcriptional regulator [Paracoccus alkanivorans]|uniref:GntR family transcriptional regulator n=1 Tax=Paracoccus alkanivorans TaxID=2116655 RepID=A0A3M0MQF0_9RHOB|nr:GntR family transcriptional regulator [Paracoccus alkanivorans]